MRLTPTLITSILLFVLCSCNTSKDKNYTRDYPPKSEDGSINVVVEIPAGTNEKWELDKQSGQIKQDTLDGKPRVIDYLPYPANYGFIPWTLLTKESGGDGDPLDVIVIGPAIERGSVVECNLIGVLYLLDSGEQDYKLIAVSPESLLFDVDDIEDLYKEYPGVTDILKTWFTSYKGRGIAISKGFGNKKEALGILDKAIESYKNL